MIPFTIQNSVAFQEYDFGTESMNSGTSIIPRSRSTGQWIVLQPSSKEVNSTSTALVEFVSDEQRFYKTNYERQRDYYSLKSKIRQLSILLEEEVDDESGAIFPTSYALNRVLYHLDMTYARMKNRFYKGSVSTSYDGGIRLEWTLPNASVRLIIPPDRSGLEYIYFEKENEYGTEQASGEKLASRLNWVK